MQWLSNLMGRGGNLLGARHDSWTILWNGVGLLGAAVFTSRFFVQWYVTEQKRVVVPVLFWWLSLAGCLLMLLYAIFYDKHIVVIIAYAFAWIPYIRNLIIHRRHAESRRDCPQCGNSCSPQSNYCSRCGARVWVQEKPVA